MSIATQIASAGPYIADGSTTQFPFAFPVLSGEQVAVYVNGTRVLLGITVVGDRSGGTVTFNTAPADGLRVMILRDMPFDQQLDLQNDTAFLPEVLEDKFDEQTMELQQLKESLERCISWPPGMTNQADVSALVKAVQDAVITIQGQAADAEAFYTTVTSELVAVRSEISGMTAAINAALAGMTAAKNEVAEMLAGAGILSGNTTYSLHILDGEDTQDNLAIRNANQALIDDLPRNLGGHTLTVEIPGFFYFGADWAGYNFRGFYNGELLIRGGTISGDSESGLYVLDCACRVHVKGLIFNGGNAAIQAWGCPDVLVSGCSFSGTFSEYGPDPGGAAVILINSRAYMGGDEWIDSGSFWGGTNAYGAGVTAVKIIGLTITN